MASLLRLGKISPKSSALFVCDIQEKFRPSIGFFPEIINVAGRMLETAKVLELPVVTTEQYPKGLGPTVKELDVSWTKVVPKTNFSMCVPDTVDALKVRFQLFTNYYSCMYASVIHLVSNHFWNVFPCISQLKSLLTHACI